MNTNLRNITLRRRYIGVISLETFSVNIFQIYATQYLGQTMYKTFHAKTDNVFFFERNISGVSHLDKFNSKKRKTFDANDLLALSLVSKLFYTYSLGKKLLYIFKNNRT